MDVSRVARTDLRAKRSPEATVKTRAGCLLTASTARIRRDRPDVLRANRDARLPRLRRTRAAIIPLLGQGLE